MTKPINKINSKSLGARIARYRNIAGLNGGDIKAAIGLTKENLSRIENGKQTPTIDTLIALCQMLGVSPDILLQDNESAPSLIYAIEEYCRIIGLNSSDAIEKLHVIRQMSIGSDEDV